MTFEEMVTACALEAGFLISSSHGQARDKPMPVSDRATLQKFSELFQKQAHAQGIHINCLDVSNHNAIVNQKNEEIASLSAELKIQDDANDILEAEIKDLKQKLSSMKIAVNFVNKANELLDKELGESKKTICQLFGESEGYKNNWVEMVKELSAAKQEIERLKLDNDLMKVGIDPDAVGKYGAKLAEHLFALETLKAELASEREAAGDILTALIGHHNKVIHDRQFPPLCGTCKLIAAYQSRINNQNEQGEGKA